MSGPSIRRALSKRTGLIFKTRHDMFQDKSVSFVDVIVSVPVCVVFKHVFFQYYLN